MAASNDLAHRAFQVSNTDNNGIERLTSSIVAPKIRISNESELRLRIKELVGDNEEWRFLAYAEADKGFLEGPSQAGSYCSTSYLKSIRHNLAVAKKACQLEIAADHGLLEDVIMATKGELSRLRRHPELFPSKDIREDFWHNVWLTCNDSVKSVMFGQEARDHAHERFEAAWVQIEEEMRIPRRDMQRKPWEQYLHNRAPGAEADLSMFSEVGSVQIIPMAAVRILMAYIEEHKAIINDIEAQREDLKSYAQSSKDYLYSNGVKRSPDGHLRSHQASMDLLKPTIAGPMKLVRNESMNNSLETLNLDFAALDRKRPPLHPRMWNCFSLVVCDRPYSDQINERAEEGWNKIS